MHNKWERTLREAVTKGTKYPAKQPSMHGTGCKLNNYSVAVASSAMIKFFTDYL